MWRYQQHKSRISNAFDNGRMNQRIWSGLTLTFLTAAFSTAALGQAQQTKAVEQDSEVSPPAAQVQEVPVTARPTAAQPAAQPTEVVKVGEFQSQGAIAQEEDVIAKIHAHEIEGRQAATLFVRNIPVLTFLGSSSATDDEIKMGEAPAPHQKAVSSPSGLDPSASNSNASVQITQSHGGMDANATAYNPLWRATTVAARLNQLNLQNVNAEAIAVSWQNQCNCYSIKVDEEELVQINDNTILPDTTNNPAEDALQATNRLRRLIGNAPPLQEIAGRPPARAVTQVSLGPIQVQVSGMASWYGPGFHGRRSASGERYNQNELTAAHRSLPFGTSVQVTNLNNGRSVVVRINDRGPYARGRVIDLSAAAARVLGMVQTGVAPVRLDILDPQQNAVLEY